MSSFASPTRRGARQPLPLAAGALLLALSACSGLGEAMTAHTDVVARAAGKELRVNDAAELLGRRGASSSHVLQSIAFEPPKHASLA